MISEAGTLHTSKIYITYGCQAYKNWEKNEKGMKEEVSLKLKLIILQKQAVGNPMCNVPTYIAYKVQ